MNPIVSNHYRPLDSAVPDFSSDRLNINIYQLRTGRHVVCYIDPSSGRRTRRKFRSLATAKEHQRELEFKLQVKGPHAFVTEPVARLMKLHLEKCPGTRVQSRKNAFVSFCDTFGHRRISDVGKVEIEGWFRKFQADHDLSDRTLATIKSQLNHFFSFLKDEGIVQHSQLSDMQFRRNPPRKRPRVVLSVDEVKALLENAKTFSPDYLYPFLYAVANTGARRGEILKLRRNDVDFNTGLLHLRKTKNGEDRSIRMSLAFLSLVKEHLARHESDFVFPSPEGGIIGRQRLHRLLQRFRGHFPMEKDWGLHCLRHSFAYNFLKKGWRDVPAPGRPWSRAHPGHG